MDSIPLAIALGDEVPLVNGAKTEQGNTNLPQEGDGCTASPNSLHEVLLSCIMLSSWILGCVLFHLCSYVFCVAFGGSPSDAHEYVSVGTRSASKGCTCCGCAALPSLNTERESCGVPTQTEGAWGENADAEGMNGTTHGAYMTWGAVDGARGIVHLA